MKKISFSLDSKINQKKQINYIKKAKVMQIFFIVFLLFTGQIFALSKTLPEVKIFDLKGTEVSTYNLVNKNSITVFMFWAMWCKPCLLELDNIAEVYEQWQKEFAVKIVAVNVDDSRNEAKLRALIKGRDWKYEIYQDRNSNFKRACNISNIPFLLIVTPDNRIVYSHVSYVNGDEKELYKKIKEETELLKQPLHK
jgi:thiol-disulfide isomerase/thioredoxin